MKTDKQEWVNKLDTKIMDWFYECIKINFGVDMVQDSTELREILEKNYPIKSIK